MRGAFALLLLGLAPLARAESNGINGYSGETVGQNCRACHTLGTVPSASISGAPFQLNVNTTANVTVTVTAGSMLSTVAGLDVSLGGPASADATLIAGSGTQIENGELTHTAPRRFDGGLADFTFGVRSGATNGALTVYVTVLAADGNTANTNDAPYSFNRTIQVSGDAGTTMPPMDSGTVDPDSGVVIVPDAGEADAGPAKPPGPSGGFVGGDTGCSTGSGRVSGAWLLALGLFGLWAQRRRR